MTHDTSHLFIDEDLIMNENEAFIKSYMQGKLPAYADYSIVEEPYGYRDEHTKNRYTVTIYIDLEKVKSTPFVPKKRRVNCDRLFNDMRALCKKRMPKLFVMFTIKRF